jgi:hypothetical protein
MGPLIPQGIIDPAWNNLIAIIIGIAFGFILESSGFSSSRKIVGVFYGYDFTVLRVFMTAVVVAMLGLIYFNFMGWIDINMIYINPLFLKATIIGGVLMAFGFIMGGYCPGTSLVGAGIGKIDGIVFTIGMAIGILIFSEAFPLMEGLYAGNDLGRPLITEFLGISPQWFAFLFTILAIVAFWVTAIIRKRITKSEIL